MAFSKAFNEIENDYLKDNLYLPLIYIFWPVVFPILTLIKWLKQKKSTLSV